MEQKNLQEIESAAPLKAGKHYRASYWVDEFGNAFVRRSREGTGTKRGHRIAEDDGWEILQTKTHYRLCMVIPKPTKKESLSTPRLVQLTTIIFDRMLNYFLKYKIYEV